MSPKGALSQQAFQEAHCVRGGSSGGSSVQPSKSESAKREQSKAHDEDDEKSTLSSPRALQQQSPQPPRGRSLIREKAESPRSQQRAARDEQLRAVFREFDNDDSELVLRQQE